MKICSLAVLALSACSLTAGMNNSDVLRMARGAAPTSEIIKKINNSTPDFRLFPEDVRHLRRRHVPASVIDAMLARNSQTSVEVPVQNANNEFHARHKNRVRGEALIVPQSTPVRLRLTSTLSSTYVRLNDPIHFEVLEDVLVNSGTGRFLVIERGSPASGTVTAVNQTRIMGHYGTVEVAIDHVIMANGDKIALSGTQRADRHIRPGLLVFALAPIGLVVQPRDPVWLTPVGKDAVLKDGLDLKVFTDGTANLDSSEFEQR